MFYSLSSPWSSIWSVYHHGARFFYFPVRFKCFALSFPAGASNRMSKPPKSSLRPPGIHRFHLTEGKHIETFPHSAEKTFLLKRNWEIRRNWFEDRLAAVFPLFSSFLLLLPPVFVRLSGNSEDEFKHDQKNNNNKQTTAFFLLFVFCFILLF